MVFITYFIFEAQITYMQIKNSKMNEILHIMLLIFMLYIIPIFFKIMYIVPWIYPFDKLQ
jgi:hypothetical protein